MVAITIVAALSFIAYTLLLNTASFKLLHNWIGKICTSEWTLFEIVTYNLATFKLIFKDDIYKSLSQNKHFFGT